MKKYLFVAFVVILVAALGFLGWQNWVLRQDQTDTMNQQVLTALGKHLLLPTEENPTMAIIQDVDKLKVQQSFFNNAANGDYLVLYAQAGKAIIYRQDQDLIVNVGPLNFTTAPADTTTTIN